MMEREVIIYAVEIQERRRPPARHRPEFAAVVMVVVPRFFVFELVRGHRIHLWSILD
jgi:hypothetical protein